MPGIAKLRGDPILLAAIILLALSCQAPDAARAQTIFGPRSLFELQPWEQLESVADVDGDGHKDFIIDVSLELDHDPFVDQYTYWCHSYGGARRILPSGGGTFADLNGDGVPELIRLGSVLDYFTGTEKVSFGDVDGDGHLDVLVGNAFGQLAVLRNDGRGGLGPAIVHSGLGDLTAMLAADFTGDGRVDLAAPGRILIGDGRGGFDLGPELGSTGPFATVDLNGDGMLDLIAAQQDRGAIAVLAGNGDGSFRWVAEHAAGTSIRQIVAADLDLDGHEDIVVSGDRVTVFHGLGNAELIPEASIAGDGPNVFVDDFDGDGRPDLGWAWGRLFLLPRHSDGRLDPYYPELYPTGAGPRRLLARDVTEDGILDFVVLRSNAISIVRGIGDGTFSPPQSYPVVGEPSSVAAADLDQDGHVDLAVADKSSGSVTVFAGGSDGTFVKGSALLALPEPFFVAAGDVDGDFISDLVLVSGNGGVAFLRGIGAGRFESSRIQRIDLTAQAAGAGDLDGDGRMDVVVATKADSGGWLNVAVVAAYGDSQGPSHWTDLLRWTSELDLSGTSWWVHALGVADLNGDCRDDVLVSSSSQWNYRGLLFTGISAYSSEPGGFRSIPIRDQRLRGSPETVFSVADFDGSGAADVAGVSGLWLDDEQGFHHETTYPIWGHTVAGDFNGDGKPDLASLNYRDATVGILLNRGQGVAAPAAPSRVTAAPIGGGIALRWAPVRHPRLAGYRIYYGIRNGGVPLRGALAREGPSGLTIPATQTSCELHCLPESLFSVIVRTVDTDGREGDCSDNASARPLPVGGSLEVGNGVGGPSSAKGFFLASIELEPGYGADDILPRSLRVNGTSGIEFVGIADKDRDGMPELRIRVPRSALVGASVIRAAGQLGGCAETLYFAVEQDLHPNASKLASEIDPTGPRSFALYAPSPNPTQGACDVAFAVPRFSHVKLGVFDVQGRRVASLMDRAVPPGVHRIEWRARGVVPGIYFIRMEADEFQAIRRTAVVR